MFDTPWWRHLWLTRLPKPSSLMQFLCRPAEAATISHLPKRIYIYTVSCLSGMRPRLNVVFHNDSSNYSHLARSSQGTSTQSTVAPSPGPLSLQSSATTLGHSTVAPSIGKLFHEPTLIITQSSTTFSNDFCQEPIL